MAELLKSKIEKDNIIDFNEKRTEKNFDTLDVEVKEIKDVEILSKEVMNLGTEMIFNNIHSFRIEKHGKLGFLLYIFKENKVKK